MLIPVDHHNRRLFITACGFERVMGSKCRNSLDIYGDTAPDRRFLIDVDGGGNVRAALYLSGSTLLIPCGDRADADAVAEFVEQNAVSETDTGQALSEQLQARLGGILESSFYMEYKGDMPTGDFSGILPCDSLEDVYSVLRQSHEYYRTHLSFGSWSGDIKKRLDGGFARQYLVRDPDGAPIGAGSIISSDEECGVPAAVAVIPEHRGRGLGSRISAFLTAEVIKQGKTPRLISGYDAVATLYGSIGYTKIGRWGEWYRDAL